MDKINKTIHRIIIALSIIDTILIYAIDIKIGSVKTELIIDIFGGFVIAFIWIKIDDNYDKTKINLRWSSFIYLIFVFCYLIVSLVRKEFELIQPVCSPVIPVFVSYYVILIKDKIEEDSLRK